MTSLAIAGGSPARTKPFPPVPYIDQEEEKLVLEVLRSRELSCYVGSPSPDIASLLTMESAVAATESLPTFNYLGGKMVRRFEAEFANYFGTPYAMAVNSAASGLSLALAACGLEPGDEVITTCMSFSASAASILTFGGVPRFVDIDPSNYCLDPALIEAAITPATRAILVVHLYGYAADMNAIMEIARRHRLAVIEDCAQAIGTRYHGKQMGTFGDAGVYSFNHPKNITTGEGAMVVTNRPEIARHVRLTRNHGEVIPNEDSPIEDLVNVIGFNMRMTEVTAAIGIPQLAKLEANNRARNDNAAYLDEELSKLPYLSCRPADGSTERAVHVCAYEYDAEGAGVPRAKVVQALRAEGLPVGTGYPRLLHETPTFTRGIAFGRSGWPFTARGKDRPPYGPGLCPVAEKLAGNSLITVAQIHRPCTREDMAEITEGFRKVFHSLHQL